MKQCKICGVFYPYCKTDANVFRWMDVACCPEHGTEYFKRVAISRGEIVEEPVVAPETPKETVKPKSTKKSKKRAEKPIVEEPAVEEKAPEIEVENIENILDD